MGGVHYSVPDRLVGQEVSVRMYSERLVIMAGDRKRDRVATHVRSRRPGDWRIDLMHYLGTFLRGNNATSARSYWSTIMSYLKSHSSFLGLKQDRFSILLPNGDIDYSVETVNGQQVKRKKTNRPKALCFDYLMLKDSFGIDLETEVSNDDNSSLE